MDTAPTIQDALRRTAQERPETGFSFSTGGELSFHSYAEMLQEAEAAGRALIARHAVAPGERVALAFRTNIDCVRAFLGLLMAGAVPVPLPPPSPFMPAARYGERMRVAFQRSSVRLMLGDGDLVDFVREALQGAASVEVIDAASLACARPAEDAIALPASSPEDAAFVQYTSGSTNAPKGVVIRHRNVLSNARAIAEGLAMQKEDVGVHWIPLFHDMGLVGGLITPIVTGVRSVLMMPEEFLLDPTGFLRVMSKAGGTICAMPNVGYLHCAKRVPAEMVPELDLSRWRVALNGAEQVDPVTMRRFCAHFAPAGFRSRAILPVYGMAEATLAVTFPACGAGMQTLHIRRDRLAADRVELCDPDHPEARELPTVGAPVRGLQVRVLDAAGIEVGPDRVGEIHVQGSSILAAYDRDPEATERAFYDGWLRTGDLGFLHDGRLYVTGRKKEVIIIGGRNIYATDVEQVATAVPGILAHGVVAVGAPGEGTEKLVLLVEERSGSVELRQVLGGQLRQAVSSALSVPVSDIVFLPRNGIPRTSSGKLERHKARALYSSPRPAPSSTIQPEMQAGA